MGPSRVNAICLQTWNSDELRAQYMKYRGVFHSSRPCMIRVTLKKTHSRTHRLPDMVSAQVFRRAHENLPPLLQMQDPGEALRPTLLELAEFYTIHVQIFPEASRRLVCDFSNNFGLHHVEALAQWLQQPTTHITIYALDLSFNRIQCP